MLVTALVAPFFVDWTVYRSTFETYAERALGHKVTVLGEADMTFLPAPTLTFSDVRVGGAEDPLLVVRRFSMRMDLPPLLKGEFHILDMTLDRPHLTVSLDEQGRPDWLTAMKSGGAIADLPADDVAFENISITDGAVTVVDARSGKTHTLDNADLNIQARSLAGPFRIDGPVKVGGNRYTLSLATGRRQSDGSIRIKGGITPDQVSMTASVDGILSAEDGLPSYDGGFELKGIRQGDAGPEVIWTANGDFKADTAQLTVSKADYHFGPQDRRTSFSGRMNMVYAGDRHFDVKARAKQIDLDRLNGGGPQKPVDLKTAGLQVLDTLKALPVPDMKGTIALDVPVVVAGGELLQDMKIDLETKPGGWHLSRFAGRVPGRTTFATEGDLVVGDRLSYRGSLSVNSDQPGALAAWLGQQDSGSSRIKPVSLEGWLNVVNTGAALENMKIELGDDALSGGLSFRKPRQGRNEFGLSLVADTLDVDQLDEFLKLIGPAAGGNDVWSGTNLSLMLQARKLRVRGVDGKDLMLQASYSGDVLKVDHLYATDLAGAEVDVSGRIEDLKSAPVGTMSGKLKATDLSGLMTLLRSAFPDEPVLARLEKASDFMVPADFDAQFTGRGTDDGSELEFQLNGTAGGVETSLDTRFSGRVDDWRKADLDATLALKSGDGGQILRQFGLDILPVDDLGQGQVDLSLRGRPEDGVDLGLTAKAPAGSLSADGKARWQEGQDLNYSLRGTLSMQDLAPFALMAGRVMPILAGEIPVDVSYALDGKGSEITLRDMSGHVGDIGFDGEVTGDLDPAPGETNRRFKGQLNVSELDLTSLSELLIGSDQWSSLGNGSSVWPTSAFGTPLLSDMDFALDLRADSMPLGLGDPAGNVQANLRLGPDEVRLDHLKATYSGGRLSGQLALRRSGAEGALSGRMKLEGADLQQLVWAADGRAVATGTLDLLADFDGAGRSISAIVAGLNGGGTLKVSKGALRGVNPQAFSLVMRAVDAGLDLEDDRIREVFLDHMKAGRLSFDTLEGALGILGGQVSARNIVVDSKAANMIGSAAINLNDLSVDSDFSLKVDAGDDAVIGAEPRVGLLFKGPLEAPQRKVDIAPFTAYLTLRAFENEVERVEKLQSEILEKQRLSRELKREKQERARKAREAEEAAEEARRKAEEEAARKQREEEQGQLPASVAPLPAPSLLDDDAQTGEVTPNGAVPATDPADFASRIRSLIDEAGNDSQAQSSETGKLKPLAPPQTVEDLLARELGLPADTLDDGQAMDLQQNGVAQ